MENPQRRLFWHGMLLFLLGLITGLVVQQFKNPRMGLAAHLEGVMNGILLLALGAAWSRVRLQPRTERVAFSAVLYGTYANWATTTAAAVFGTRSMTPLTSGTSEGLAWQELLVTLGFGSVGVAMLGAAILLLWGFRRSMRAEFNEP